MVFINFIKFNIIQIIYYENISHGESKNTSLVLLKLIEFTQTIVPGTSFTV
jgi:hypothetical protein